MKSLLLKRTPHRDSGGSFLVAEEQLIPYSRPREGYIMISWVSGSPYEGQLIYIQTERSRANNQLEKLNESDPWIELENLVGLESVKKEIREICAYASICHKRRLVGLKADDLTLNMSFVGNPGTGKTTVARIIGKILKTSGVISGGQLVEVERAELVGEYVGHTAKKTKDVINKALGGILFIDEAYSLARGGEKDFGKEAIDTLVKAMEDHRHELIVIAAGYPNEMDKFLKLNPGLQSRVPIHIEFQDYTEEELMEIALLLAAKKDYRLAPKAVDRLRKNLKGLKGNGRDVRNILEGAMRRQALRLNSLDKLKRDDLMTLKYEDF